MGSGHGQTFSFGGTAIEHIEDVKFTGKGQIMSKIVADEAFPLTITVPGLAKWTVTFSMPETTPHSALANLAQGETGAIVHDKVAGVKISAASGISAGFDIGVASGGWVTVTAEFSASGAVTFAAATA